MKRTLFLILCFLLVVVLGIALYFFFFATPSSSDIEDSLPTLSGTQYSGFQSNEQINSGSFEESFYQDLSDFFNSDTNYYQNIQGEHGFIQP